MLPIVDKFELIWKTIPELFKLEFFNLVKNMDFEDMRIADPD